MSRRAAALRIKVGFDIQLGVWAPTSVIFLLRIHPSRRGDIVGEEQFSVTGGRTPETYEDSFGNLVGRVEIPEPVPAVVFTGTAIVEDSGKPDPIVEDAQQVPTWELPTDVLEFLLPSRYCDFDGELMQVAWNNFAHLEGWPRVQAISDYTFHRLRYDSMQAKPTRTATEGNREEVGVCRDFAHLFIALCRAMNIPARYVSGYLGDIQVTPNPTPMDFHAWAEVFLGGEWHVFDPRHNARRIGHIPMARGRDAADVPITMGFGPTYLHKFEVVAEETT